MNKYIAVLAVLACSFQTACGPGLPAFPPGTSANSVTPATAFVRPLDPIVKIDASQTIELSSGWVGSASVSSVHVAFANNGSDYTDAEQVQVSQNRFQWTVPATASSSTTARLKFWITLSGNNFEIESDPFMVLTQLELIAGPLNAGVPSEGQGTTARFRGPSGIASDGTYLYIGDLGAIVRVHIATGQNEWLVGNYLSTDPVDGTATSARVGLPIAVCYLGNSLYFLESASHAVRRLNLDSLSAQYLSVDTFAGSLTSTGSTDAVGTSARFNTPQGIATDGTYIYVADSGNHTIRRIDPGTATVSTYAGAAGTQGTTDGAVASARFTTPRGLQVQSGYLYVMDSANLQIRRIDLSLNTVTSFFATSRITGHANGTASVGRISSLITLASDSTNLYALEQSFHTVRKINLGTATSTALAGVVGEPGVANGTGSARLGIPQSIVVVGSYGYVTDQGSMSIRKIDTATGEISTLAGALGDSLITADSFFVGDMGHLNLSQAVTTTDGDTFYISQFGSHTIRKVSLSGNSVTTIAGALGQNGNTDATGTAASFNAPMGLVEDNGYLYVCDRSNHAIRRIDLATNAVTIVAGSTAGTAGTSNGNGTAARFNFPYMIISDGTYLYISDSGAHTIRTLQIGGSWTVDTLAGTAASAGTSDGVGSAARFRSPRGLALSADKKTLYVADASNNLIRSIDIDPLSVNYRQVTTIAGQASVAVTADGTGTGATFVSPSHLAADSTNLWITDTTAGLVRRMNLSTGVVTTVVGGGDSTVVGSEAVGRTALAASVSGITQFGTKLYFVVAANRSYLRSIDTTTFQTQTLAGYSSVNWDRIVRGDNDGTLADYKRSYFFAGSDGNYIYALDSRSYAIYRLSMDGSSPTLIIGNPGTAGTADGVGTAARLGDARGLVVSGDYVYFVDSWNHTLRRFSRSSFNVETVAGGAGQSGTTDGTGTTARFNFPAAVCIDGEFAYITDRLSHTVRKVSLQASAFGEVTTLAGSGGVSGSTDGTDTLARFNLPWGCAVLNGILYVADRGNNTLRAIDLSSSTVSTVLGSVGFPGLETGAALDSRISATANVVTDGKYLYLKSSPNTFMRYDPVESTTEIYIGSAKKGALLTTSQDVRTAAHSFMNMYYVPSYGLLLSGQRELGWAK